MAGNRGETPETESGTKAKVTYVGMNGVADHRRITKADWEAIGVADGKDREWRGAWVHESPNRTLEDNFSTGELAYFEMDPDFKVEK